MEYRSIHDLNLAIGSNLHRIPKDADLIVGVPRSGLLAANMLALHLNLPLADLDGFLEGRVLSVGKARGWSVKPAAAADRPRKVIVLDDSLWSGNELEHVRKKIVERVPDAEVRIGVVYCNPDKLDLPDFYLESCPMPRIFEWNLMHHSMLKNACFDIDGVLCRDPTEEENDDGDRYRAFLASAETLFIPTVEIGWLVTSRLEKYRKETEAWLEQHQVRYRELRMLDLPSKAMRIALGSHGAFKAQVYRETGAELFVESNRHQAVQIARLTGKHVFCVDNRTMIGPGDCVEDLGLRYRMLVAIKKPVKALLGRS